jgi:hypothetical protein
VVRERRRRRGEGDDRTLRRWDAATGRPLGEPLPIADADERSVAAATPDGRLAAVYQADRSARFWDLTRARPVGEPVRVGAGVVWLGWAAREQRLVALTDGGADDQAAAVWAYPSGQLVRSVRPPSPPRGGSAVLAVGLHHQDRLIVCERIAPGAVGQHETFVIDLPAGRTYWCWPRRYAVGVRPDGTRWCGADGLYTTALDGPSESVTAWVQVVTRQELAPGSDGPRPFDEATWAGRRRQLASWKPGGETAELLARTLQGGFHRRRPARHD